MRVYCEDKECWYWKKGKCTAKILLMWNTDPPLSSDCECCLLCLPFSSMEEYREWVKFEQRTSLGKTPRQVTQPVTSGGWFHTAFCGGSLPRIKWGKLSDRFIGLPPAVVRHRRRGAFPPKRGVI